MAVRALEVPAWLKKFRRNPFLRASWPGLALVLILTLLLFLAYQTRPVYEFKLTQPELDEGLNGFYGVETNPAFSYRWSEPQWEIELPLAGRQSYELELSVLGLKEGVTQVQTAAGESIGSFSPTYELKTFRLNLSPQQAPGNKLALKVISPIYRAEGDPRDLGLVVTHLTLKSTGTGILLPPTLAWAGLVGLALSLYLIPAGFLSLGGGLLGRWPVVLPGFGLGLVGVWLAAFERRAFARLVWPLAGYLLIAVALQYLFLLGPLLLEWLEQRFGIAAKFQGSKQATLPLFKASQPPYSPVLPKSGEVELSTRKEQLTGLAIVALYLTLRLVNIMSFPIFTDEASHILAAQRAQVGEFWELGQAGKALHGWLLAFLYKIFGLEEILLVARLLSVAAGLVTLAGCYLIGQKLYSVKAGLIAAFLWAILPLAVWHERLALVDPLMTAFTTLVLVFSLRLFEVARPLAVFGYGLLVGLALTGAELVKLSGLAALIIPPLTLVVLQPVTNWLKLARRLSVIGPVFFLTTVPLIRLAERGWGNELSEARFAGYEQSAFVKGLGLTVDWLYHYLGLPLLILVALLPLWVAWKDRRPGLLLLLTGLLPLLALLIISRSFYSRYLLFMLVPLIILIGGRLAGLQTAFPKRWRTLARAGLWLGLILPPLWFDGLVATDPLAVPLPIADRSQYIEDLPGGYGVNGAVDFLKQEAIANSGQPLNVLTTINAAEPAFQALLANRPSISVKRVFPPQFGLANRLRRAVEQGPTYLVISLSSNFRPPLMQDEIQPAYDDRAYLEAIQAVAPDLKLKLVYAGKKPGERFEVQLYRLTK